MGRGLGSLDGAAWLGLRFGCTGGITARMAQGYEIKGMPLGRFDVCTVEFALGRLDEPFDIRAAREISIEEALRKRFDELLRGALNA